MKKLGKALSRGLKARPKGPESTPPTSSKANTSISIASSVQTTIEEPSTKTEPDNGTEERNALTELNTAVLEFKEHYELLAKRNEKMVRIDEAAQTAILEATKNADIQSAATFFGSQISAAIRARTMRQETPDSVWSNKLCKFLTKLYPVARLSLGLTSALAEVYYIPHTLAN